jgi:hypothetical protein
MQWYSRIDPETNQVLVGFRTVISTIAAVMIIAFADDIKNLVIDAETSGLMEANTRQNIEIIAKSVEAHESIITSHSERILRMEFANKEHSRLQNQITKNTDIIRKIQNAQIRVIAK